MWAAFPDAAAAGSGLHAAVLGLKAAAMTAPYGVPPWLPDVLTALAAAATAPPPTGKVPALLSSHCAFLVIRLNSGCCMLPVSSLAAAACALPRQPGKRPRDNQLGAQQVMRTAQAALAGVAP